jgi:hypothetical protein
MSHDLRITARTNADWSETLPNGTKLSVPIKSIQIEVGYPDFNQPLGSDNKPNLKYHIYGLHYLIDPKGPFQYALWTRENQDDIFEFSLFRLDQPIQDWDPDEVMIRNTIVFDPADPRVDLRDNKSIFVHEERTKDHTLKISLDGICHIFIHFRLDRPIPNDAVSMTLTCAIGERRDTLNINKSNYKNVIWEIFSDKYLDETSFTYDLQVEVVGPNFTDPPVNFGTPNPVRVDLPTGRLKYISPLKLPLPPIPPDKVDTVNKYIKQAQ